MMLLVIHIVSTNAISLQSLLRAHTYTEQQPPGAPHTAKKKRDSCFGENRTSEHRAVVVVADEYDFNGAITNLTSFSIQWTGGRIAF